MFSSAVKSSKMTRKAIELKVFELKKYKSLKILELIQLLTESEIAIDGVFAENFTNKHF
jgi:hypothetical protein